LNAFFNIVAPDSIAATAKSDAKLDWLFPANEFVAVAVRSGADLTLFVYR
jgi:hypothetical protein